MIINLIAQNSYKTLSASRQGDALTINGEVFDFTAIPEGATLPAEAIVSEWLSGDIERINGEIVLTLLIPVTEKSTAKANFPSPLINPANGVLEFPK